MVHVTVPDEAPREQFAVTGATTGPFAFDFTYYKAADIDVYDDATLKTEGVHYSLVGTAGTEGGYVGGVITWLSSITSRTITVVLNISISRLTDFPSSGAFNITTLNTEIDTIYSILSQNKDSFSGRSLRLPASDAADLNVLPVASARVDKVLSFDSTGAPNLVMELGQYGGNWTTATAYTERTLIKDSSNNNIYFCNLAHTSTGSTPISSNADVAKWDLLIDAVAAAASASAAAVSATAAAADVVSTNADVVLTHADVVLTHADVVLTTADLALTNADVTASATSATAAGTSATNAATSATASATSATASAASAAASSGAAASATAAAASATAAAADEVLTNADTILTAADVVSTHADVVLTGIDAAATAVDRAATAVSAAAAAADAVQTALDLVATNQDTIDTAADLVQTAADVTASAASASAAATSATAAAGSATAAAADLVQTNIDQIATAADAVSTAADVIASAASAAAAATSATSAATARTAAEAAQTAAEAALDSFDDIYLGAKASDPTLDNDGAALATGALYWNTTGNTFEIYSGSAWNSYTIQSLVTLAIANHDSITVNANDEAGGVTWNELQATPSISSGVVTVDLHAAQNFKISLSESITTVTISNPPAAGTVRGFTIQLLVTGSFTVAWPASVEWPSGTAPTLSTTSGHEEIFSFFTEDGGTTYKATGWGQAVN